MNPLLRLPKPLVPQNVGFDLKGRSPVILKRLILQKQYLFCLELRTAESLKDLIIEKGALFLSESRMFVNLVFC